MDPDLLKPLFRGWLQAGSQSRNKGESCLVNPQGKGAMRIWLVILSCLVFSGCTHLDRTHGPSTIIVRNNTGIHMKEVSIRAVEKKGRYTRVGAISPLPAGVSQTVGRPSNPPNLPKELLVCWKDENENQVCKKQNLIGVLKGVKGTGTAIVFDIFTRSEVRVYLENGQ